MLGFLALAPFAVAQTQITGSYNHHGDETFSGNFTATAAQNQIWAQSTNNILVVGCTGSKYPATIAGLQAALAQAIKKGGGIVDARGMPCGLNITSEIDVGNASGVPVTLLLPESGPVSGCWTITITDGMSYGLKVFSNSAAISTGMAYGTGFVIALASTANVAAMCGNDALVADSHIRMDGFD